jgi:hypothetical protein
MLLPSILVHSCVRVCVAFLFSSFFDFCISLHLFVVAFYSGGISLQLYTRKYTRVWVRMVLRWRKLPLFIQLERHRQNTVLLQQQQHV